MPVLLSSYSRPPWSSTRAEENSLDRESSANPSSDDALEQVEDELLEDVLLEDERAEIRGIKRKSKFEAPGRETPKRARYSVMEGGNSQGESSTRAQGTMRRSSSPEAGTKVSSPSMSTPATMRPPPHNGHSESSLSLPSNLPVFTSTLTSARKNLLMPSALLPKPNRSYLTSRKTGVDYAGTTAIRSHPDSKNKGKDVALRERASAAVKLSSSSSRARDASMRDVVQGKARQLVSGAPVEVGSRSASTSASVSNAVDKRRSPIGSEILPKSNVEKGSRSGSVSANKSNSDIRNFFSGAGKTSKLELHSPSKRSVLAPAKPRTFSSSSSSFTGFAPPSMIKLEPKLSEEKIKTPRQSAPVPQSEIIEISDDDSPPPHPRLREKTPTTAAGEFLEISSSQEERAPLRARTLQSTQATPPTRPRPGPLPRKAYHSMPNPDTEAISLSSSDDELLEVHVASTSKSVPVSARAHTGLPSSILTGPRRPPVRLQSTVQFVGMPLDDPMGVDGDSEPPPQSPSPLSASWPQTPPWASHRDDSDVVMSRPSSPALRRKLQSTTRGLPTVLQSSPSAPQKLSSSTLTKGNSLPVVRSSSGGRKSSLALNSWMNLDKDANGKKKDLGPTQVSTMTSGASSSVQLPKASIRRKKKSSLGSIDFRPLNQPTGAKTKDPLQSVSKNPKRHSLLASKPSSHVPLSQKTAKSVAETIMLAGKLNATLGTAKSPAGLSRDQAIDLTFDDSEDEEPPDLAQSSSSSHPPQEISRSSTDELAIRPSQASTEDAASPAQLPVRPQHLVRLSTSPFSATVANLPDLPLASGAGELELLASNAARATLPLDIMADSEPITQSYLLNSPVHSLFEFLNPLDVPLPPSSVPSGSPTSQHQRQAGHVQLPRSSSDSVLNRLQASSVTKTSSPLASSKLSKPTEHPADVSFLDPLAHRPDGNLTSATKGMSPGADTTISSASVPSQPPSSEMEDLIADDLPIISESEGDLNVDKLMCPSTLRRSSRQLSSASGSSENLIPYGGDYEGGYDSSASSPAPAFPVPSLNVEGGKTYTGIKAMTWAEYRKNLANFEGKCYYSKDLPHSLQDTINSMSEEMRMLSGMRDIFRATIRENTAEDEPDAPDIEVVNNVDAEPTPPWEFHYTNKLWHGEGVPPPDIKNLTSCDCVGRCDPKSKTCACLQRQSKYYGDPNPDFAYDARGKLKHPGYPIFECNDLCGCDDECRNRVVQHGRTLPVKIAKTATKGWGVFNGPKKIQKGTFIGVYAGELLTDTESEQRGLQYNLFGRTYLFDLDFHHLKEGNDKWEIQYVVDAYHAGNFTRFVNHSCEPNSRLYACYINEANIDKPILAVFAIRDIEADEEITFSYTGYYPEEGYSDDEDEDDESASDGGPAAEKNNTAVYRSCLCGAARCKGTMFN